MYLEIIKKILTNQPITLDELNAFLDEYVSNQLKRPIDAQQLAAMVQLIQMGQLDLRFAATQAAILANLNVLNVHDKDANIISTYIYEEPINT